MWVPNRLNPGPATSVEPAPSPASEGSTQNAVESEWTHSVEHHFLRSKGGFGAERRSRSIIRAPADFNGRLRGGTLGRLSYCHLAAGPHVFVGDQLPLAKSPGNWVLLQLSGSSIFSTGKRKVEVRPGDIMFLNMVGPLLVEHESKVEQLVLLEPFSAEVAKGIGPPGLHLSDSRCPLGRIVFRWLRDACLEPGLNECDASHDLARALTEMLEKVVFVNGRQANASSRRALTRERILAYVERHLADQELCPDSVAAAFGCSVRSVHRAFGNSGQDSLARYIWRMRIEACARAIRDGKAGSTTLTELALNYGFKSSSHFSVLFRELMGMSPSAYRHLQMEG